MIAAQGRNDDNTKYSFNDKQNYSSWRARSAIFHFAHRFKLELQWFKNAQYYNYLRTIKPKKETNSLNFCNIEVI